MEACKKIELYASLFPNAESFFESNNQMEFNACLNQLAQIGEQSGKISKTLSEKHTHIFWSEIKSFRNRIIHEYIGIDRESVFEIVKKYVPQLQDQVIPVIVEELKNNYFDMDEFVVAKTSPYLKHIDFTVFEF